MTTATSSVKVAVKRKNVCAGTDRHEASLHALVRNILDIIMDTGVGTSVSTGACGVAFLTCSKNDILCCSDWILWVIK